MVYFSPTFIALAAAAMGLVQAAPTTDSGEQQTPPSASGLCTGNLKKTDIPLWIGAPKRQDAAHDLSVVNSTWWKEVTAVSNAIMDLQVRVDDVTAKGKWEYIPRVIFGAPKEYTNFDNFQLGEDKFANAAPMVRVTEADSSIGAVNLNLFPLSESPMQLCIHFKLPEKAPISKRSDGSTTPNLNADTHVAWYRALQSAIMNEQVQNRLKQNEVLKPGISPSTTYGAMAMLEMMTGLPSMFAWRKLADHQDLAFADGDTVKLLKDVEAMRDWLFEGGANGNWNPTVMSSPDSGLRAVRPMEELRGAVLEDSRAPGPDDFIKEIPEFPEHRDRARVVQELWDDSFVWAARLRTTDKNPIDTLEAIKKAQEFTTYFTEP